MAAGTEFFTWITTLGAPPAITEYLQRLVPPISSVALLAAACPNDQQGSADAMAMRSGFPVEDAHSIGGLAHWRLIVMRCNQMAQDQIRQGVAESDTTPVDDPIPSQIQLSLLDKFASTYGYRPTASRTPADRLLGRLWREEIRKDFKVVAIPTVSSVLAPFKTATMLRISDSRVSVEQDVENTDPSTQLSLARFLGKLRTLLNGYAIVGCKRVQYQGMPEMERYCEIQDVEDYYSLVIEYAEGSEDCPALSTTDLIRADHRTRSHWVQVMRRHHKTLSWAIRESTSHTLHYWVPPPKPPKPSRPKAEDKRAKKAKPKVQPQPPKAGKTAEVCRQNQAGNCGYGSNCRFVHQ